MITKDMITEAANFKVGDLVKIKPEFRDDPKDDGDYEIIEWNVDRGFMRTTAKAPKNSGHYITPTELIRANMIVKSKGKKGKK